MTSRSRTVSELDKYQLAEFLENVADSIRNNRYDVQSSFDGVEITSYNLDGFYIHIQGQTKGVIEDTPSFKQIVRRMFHEKNHVCGPFVDVLIDEAEYQIENYFEWRDDFVEDAFEKCYSPEILYQVAYSMWSSEGIMYNEYLQDITSDALGDILPSEIYLDRD
jgi:hypothetical protein